MGRRDQDISRIDVELEFRRNMPDWKSILFFDGNRKVWLPKSLIVLRKNGRPVEGLQEGDNVTVNLPEWLAVERGLI